MEIIGYKQHIPALAAEYPDVDVKSIEHLVRHGLAMMSMFAYGDVDIFLNNNHDDFYAYIGLVVKDALKRKIHSNSVMHKKPRVLYKANKTKYSGFRYMMLDEEQNERYLAGETITKTMLCLLPTDAKLYRKGRYLYTVPHEKDSGFIVKELDYKPIGAELIEKRENKYEANSLQHVHTGVEDGSESTNNS